jgi:hypothetical protein
LILLGSRNGMRLGDELAGTTVIEKVRRDVRQEG